MARVITTVSAKTRPAFVAAVNVVLAALVNPTLNQLSWSITQFPRRLGTQYRLTLSHTTGGAGLATPFLIRIDEDESLAAAAAVVQTFLTANAAYFVAGARMFYNDAGPKLPLYSLITLYNTTGGASANYAQL